MHSFVRSLASGLAATSALALVLGSIPALADDGDYNDNADPGVARLSVLRGDVDIKRADSNDTVAGAVNAPVSEGDYVTTRADSRVEIQYGFGSAIRVAPDTQLRFTHLDPTNHALQLAEGTVEMRVFRGLEAHPEVDTPSATIRPDERGQYRITVTNDGNTEVTVRSGHADVTTQSGTQTISPDSTLLVEGEGNDVRFRTIETVANDGFDEWNAERDSAFERVRDYAYVDQGIVGADDLDQYGHWVDEASYGEVWTPNEPADWSPYSDGRWVWEPYYGWTWIGAEPWGYAPYHYGNWFYANNNWFWYPGARTAVRVYRPALVGFFSFGFGGGGLSVGFGNIGWVPLAPFEAFHPWWGRGYENRTSVVNITNITINNYRNLRAPHAAVAVTNANFANGNFSHVVPLHANQLKTITAVRGVVPVVPTEHNLAFNAHASASLASAPLSTRFSAFRTTTVARPPSFTAQRETVAAAAQKQYPERASVIDHPEKLPAPAANGLVPSEDRGTTAERNGTPERNVTPSERDATTPERSAGTTSGSHDPWSRFGDSPNSTTHSNPSRDTPTAPTTNHTTSSSPAYGTRSTTSGDTGGNAWRRFNGNGTSGAAAPGSTTRSSGNSTGSYGSGSTRPSYSSGTRPSYSSGEYGSNAGSSNHATTTTHRYDSGGSAGTTSHAPNYTPSYHQAPPAGSHPAPANHQPQASHAAPPAAASKPHDAPSKSSDKPHDDDHGH
jgi:hypothetical protein